MNVIVAKLLFILALCSVDETKIYGPIDLLIVLDESDSMRSVSTDRMKKFVQPHRLEKGGIHLYSSMMKLVENVFKFGEKDINVAMLCTGLAYQAYDFTHPLPSKFCEAKEKYANNLTQTFTVAGAIMQMGRNNFGKMVLGTKYVHNSKYCTSCF